MDIYIMKNNIRNLFRKIWGITSNENRRKQNKAFLYWK